MEEVEDVEAAGRRPVRPASSADTFSELGGLIDLPVRTYSAGMLARLAFAVSTSIDPEILLMDEWLFAGDAWSLEKARRRVEGFVGTSHIMVLASHSFPLLQEWCNRGVLLDNGRVAATGNMADVIATYQARMAERGQMTS